LDHPAMPQGKPMRVATAAFLTIFSLPTFAVAGDTMLGPTSLKCGDVRATTERTALVLMWVQG
jgi:hypothetical protein